MSHDPAIAGRDLTRAERSTRQPGTDPSTGPVPQGLTDLWLSETPALEGALGSWSTFWEATPEKQRIVRAEALDYVSRLSRFIALEERLRVMDFGCGTGHIAETLAQRVSEVAVWDASHAVRARTGRRLAGHPNISFLDLNDDIGTQRAGRFDLILSHSVVQYMTHAEFARWLCTWASMLTTNGAIVLSDVITDGRTTARELFDLAVFATRHHALLGTLLDELSSLLRYAHTRANASLLTLRPGELTALAHEQGLQLEVLPANLGHKTGRLAVVLS